MSHLRVLLLFLQQVMQMVLPHLLNCSNQVLIVLVCDAVLSAVVVVDVDRLPDFVAEAAEHDVDVVHELFDFCNKVR